MPIDSHRIPRNRIQIADHPVQIGAGARTAHEPRIDVIRDAAGIREIRVTCRCGEVLRLDLDYGKTAA